MKNIFFQKALQQAAGTLTRKNRLLNLVSQLLIKSQHVNWQHLKAGNFKSKISLFGRLSKAYALGHYRDVSWKTMLTVVGAVIYFVNPFDLLPDIVPIAGFTDDFGILMWVYSSLHAELDKFLVWEQSQPQNS
jgi:uncharacterized membrane protein YkvA (DUF1232 family)